ncbi:nuclear transport factor 2 family protein [Rubricoccus marinus]|uniref:nuclear transport factor 2 family protein n=1 Tax=Rubricoccus marinus TaxID=716817 RepID=UPI000B990001|nr:nuclear transport factor 2 family protein [Rubricoccus marinus]
MRAFALLAFVLLTGCASSAQTPEASGATPDPATSDPVAQVKATIATLFDGMRAGDSTMVRSTFHPDMRLNTVAQDGEGYRLVGGDAERFLQAVGTPHDEAWDERIGEIDVRVDAGLATAWMAYRFYVGDTFSHCGVNSMQLARLDGRWQIVSLVDTRRQACE